MRRIDADKLEEEIKRKICGECEHHSDKRCSVYCAAYQLLHNLIPNARTWGSDAIEQLREKLRLANLTNRRIVANYPPITHGHWMRMYGCYPQLYTDENCMCSKCHHVIDSPKWARTPKYCPECGAKMNELEPYDRDEENRLLTMDEVRAQRLVWAEYKERPTDIAKLLLVCWLKRYSGYDYFAVINEDGIFDGHIALIRVYPKHTAIRFWWKEPTQEERELEWGGRK